MKKESSYLRAMLVAWVATGAVAVGINWFVDPYGLFGSPPIDGFNRLKPASAERSRLVKPYLADRVNAATVIGGNSRPEIGLDPASPCWASAQKPVFNAGIPGADVRLQSLYAMHARSERTALMLHGVDFMDFVKVKGTQAPSGERTPELKRLHVPELAPPDAAHHLQRASDRLTSLLSLTALVDSIHTIAAQRNPNASTRTRLGFNPANDYLDIIRSEGQNVLFTQKNSELRRQFEANFELSPLDGRNPSSFTDLRRLIEWAKKNGVKLKLFINPYHVDYQTLVMTEGKWSLFEQWKRALTEMAWAEGVELWDFNTVDAFSTEPMPGAGDKRTVLNWYWEPSHYRSELGELMLARMLDADCAGANETERFGIQLQPAMVDGHLAQLRRQVLDASRRANHQKPVSSTTAK